MPAMPSGGGVTLQHSLPLQDGAAPRRRSGPAVDAYAISIPARQFTGDFFYTHRDGDALWLALGDVAGKGLNAAVVMAIIQETLEQRIASCAQAMCDPAVTVGRMHEVLRQVLPPNRFATTVIARLRDDGMLFAANAGHPPPLIARGGGAIEQIASTGPAIGIVDGVSWRSVVRRLEPGDALLLYSDGVIEANDFGLERLAAAFARAASLPARSAAAAVTSAVREHGGIEDDLTVMVARRPT